MNSTNLTRPTDHAERRLSARRRDTSAKPAHIHRERDFGVGYGNSSGYASYRSYVASRPAYFRCR